MPETFYQHTGKRLVDLALSLLGLVALFPVFLLISLAVFVTSGWPVFFRQVRTGRHAQPFRIWKFRTMKTLPPGNAPLLTAAGDARVTPFGRVLRATKSDELPQLFNVLSGDMSLVGPRPEVPRYTALYSGDQKLILTVRPGITGPAAAAFIAEEELLAAAEDMEHFYVSTILPAKLQTDLRYVRSISFNKDLRILAHTFIRLLFYSSQSRGVASRAPQSEV